MASRLNEAASNRSASPAPPRLLADAMLGGLARWLRVLGIDVAYDPELDDDELVKRAVAESRTILTRDSRLIQRRAARNHLFIRSEVVEEQLLQVLSELPIRVNGDDLFGRCLRCNTPLREMAAAEARRRVPPYVARTQEEFRYCPTCDRIYWAATHVQRMLRKLEKLGLEEGIPRQQPKEG